MKKFILWDNDGVLVDTEKYYFKANQIVLKELDVDLTVEQFKKISLKDGKSVLELARKCGLDDSAILELRDKRDKVYEQFIFNDNIALPHVQETLKKLYGKIGMGVVTSTKKAYFEFLHNKTGFNKYFEFVVAREEYKVAKPDPEPYLIGIEKSGFSKSEIIAVEDTPRGIIAAKTAGIQCVFLPNQFTKDIVVPEADIKLDSITEITHELISAL